jgi:hypothetical protein
MRNSILAGVMLSCSILGGVVGGNIKPTAQQAALDDAWDSVTVVADGTFVANPAYYADHPEDLAMARHVRIIDNSRAAMEAAWPAIGVAPDHRDTPALRRFVDQGFRHVPERDAPDLWYDLSRK